MQKVALPPQPVFPLPDEPHLADWRRYHAEAGTDPFAYLQTVIAQLNVPVSDGVSATAAYGAVARRGEPFAAEDFNGRLHLERPDVFRFSIQSHPAGSLPVLRSSHRPDFEVLYRALAYRSEPVAIPPSVNAIMIAGFINWERVGRYRDGWLNANPDGDWSAEMRRTDREEPGRFRDRFMLTGEAPYSGLSAATLGLPFSETAWREHSTQLRLEHEFTHYATKRLYDAMRNNLLDELIADFMGLTLALGDYRADWFLSFLGLERYPAVRPGGRIDAYRETLTGPAFDLLCRVTIAAARQLENEYRAAGPDADRLRFFFALTQTTLEELAAGRGPR